MKALSDVNEKFGSTRRGFLKGMLGMGAAATLYGCSGSSGDEIFYMNPPSSIDDGLDTRNARFVYGTSAHNCGGRCIIRGQVINGKIARFLTDENAFGYKNNGTTSVMETIDMDDPNCTQARACSRCRSYRFRLYHAGRLRYPMKQTGKRGDLSTFVRVSWDEALEDIAKKHKLTYEKYGPDAMYVNYASAAGGSQGSAAIWSPVMNIVGGYTSYWGSYSTHQWRYCVNGYSGFPQQVNSTGQGYSTDYTGNSYHANCNDIGLDGKNVVMWGSNYITTYHQYSYSTIRALENMKKNNAGDPNGGKAIFIGPEFVDQGVTVATEWIRSKPYTDPAFMIAMICEMIKNTFDGNGAILPQPWLDVDYLDTMVYGFFDSPKYWLETATNEIFLTAQTSTKKYPVTRTGGSTGFRNVKVDWSNPETNMNAPIPSIPSNTTVPYIFDFVPEFLEVNAIPDGRSLSAYIMGSDDRLAKAVYAAPGDKTNYVAMQFAGKKRNMSTCSYPVKGQPANTTANTSSYKTKSDYAVVKDAAWASRITGVPAQTIIDMAKFYADKNNHPIYSEWCGGLQKQADGVNNLVIMQMLCVITKCWGIPGSGYGRGIDSASSKVAAADAIPNISPGNGTAMTTPVPSCTAWHNAAKVAYADDLRASGYTARWVPDYNDIGSAYMDDGGTKALVAWDRTGSAVNTYSELDSNGKTMNFFKWKGKDLGQSALYSGFRFIMNCGGNILINQHECSNDLADMWQSIPTYDASNPDADSLCIVTFDNYLSPTPRWSDYVLPAATTWEQPTTIQPVHGSYMYIPTVTAPPGESLSQFDFGHAFLKKYEKVAGATGLAKKYTWNVDNMTVEDRAKANFATVSNRASSPFYKRTWEEFLENPYLPGIPDNTTRKLSASQMRIDLDAYLATAMSAPFVNPAGGMPFIMTYHSAEGLESPAQGGYGNEYPYFEMPSKTLAEVTKAPDPSGRFQVYSGTYVWQYEWRFSKWHGHLASEQRGQRNSDLESDPVVYPIPMYFAYEDYFMEAYGKPVDQLFTEDPKGPLLLTTTHNRFRSHSTFAENGYLREFTHRTVKGSANNNAGVHTIKPGGLYSGDDWNEYALSAPLSGDMARGSGGVIPRLNKPIEYKQGNATYSEFWINTQDAADRGIEDGDLVLVKNPVGSVRVVARVSERCAPGFVGLHQGCWYDPDLSTAEWVDDGGNCNTLMAQKHSRVDHGNGQQSAMVSVTKITL